MRIQEEDLAPEVLKTALLTLAGDPNPGSVRQGGALLYLCQSRGDFVKQMPVFDEWGPRPAGLQGPRENPMVVTALPVGQDDSSNGGAGRQEAPEAEGAPGAMIAPSEAHEEAALGARAAKAEGGEQPPAAPGAKASEALAAFLGEVTGSAHQAETPDAGRLDIPSSS